MGFEGPGTTLSSPSLSFPVCQNRANYMAYFAWGYMLLGAQLWRGHAVVKSMGKILGKLKISLILFCLERLEMSFWKVAARRKTLPLTLWSSG